MLFLTLILFLIFSRPVLAEDISPTATPSATTITPSPTISLVLSDVPDQSITNTVFTAKLTLNNAKPNLEYHFKISGSTGSGILVGPNWISGYNGSWDQMPTTSTDATGQASILINLKTPNSGVFGLTGKIVESLANDNGLESTETKNITIISPSPTPITPTPSPITPTPISPTPTVPTSTPTPISPTPTRPTSTPTKYPTSTPIPTIAPLPTDPPLTPVIEPTSALLSLEEPTPTTGDVLGLSDIIKPTSTPSSFHLPQLPSNLIPLICIGLGGILLLSPLIIAKIKS